MRTITNVFLLNLAISDILLGVLCMPVTLVGTLLRHFIFGEFFCKLIQFSQAASVAVSSWTLVAISCERYYAICHPLRSRRWQTRSHAYKIIACIWFGSMLCMTPIAIFSQLMPTSRQGYRKCRENWPSYALPYERPYNIFLDLVLLVLPLVILSVAYTLITRTLYVGMRIEKAMIFGGGAAAGSGTSNCNGKLNCDELYSTVHAKCGGGSSYSMTTASNNINKGAYLSTTMATTTPTSSMTTLASTSSSAMSRLRFQFSLRRHGPVTTTNVTMKHNGCGGVAVGSLNNTTAAGNIGIGNGGGGGLIMRSHFSLNKETHLDNTMKEDDFFQQQPSSSTKHYQQQQQLYSNQHQRLFQQQQQQQQNHCHNYHQHQMLLHHETDQDLHHHQQQQQQHVSTKFCCDNISRFCCGKRPTSSTSNSSGSNNGRRHLYCMRFATLRAVPPDNDSINATSSYCTSECCSSSSCGGVGSGCLGAGGMVATNNTTGPLSCCSNNTATSNVGNLPSTSSSSLASSSATYSSYRYQMHQQHYHHHHPLHPYNGMRSSCIQQVNHSDPYGKSTSAGGVKKFFSSNKRNLRSSDSVLRRNNMAKNLESKKRVVKMLSVLVLEFFICWTPLYVINTVAMYIGSAIYEYIDYKSISALQLLAYSSSCCNPITYCFMNANFRRAFLDTFKGMQWCGIICGGGGGAGGKRFRRKRSTQQNGNLCLAGNSSIRVNSCTVQTVIDSPRL
ncbi:uncharacterized protein [Musca autumnalis]|uniref:uncharacterized protein n=1 Tax=Musca autumnalis TaxID=221902 RepID=UPI003CF08101